MQRTGRSAAAGVIQPGMVRALPTPPTEPAQPGTPGMPEMPQPPTAGEAAAPGPVGRSGSDRFLADAQRPDLSASHGAAAAVNRVTPPTPHWTSSGSWPGWPRTGRLPRRRRRRRCTPGRKSSSSGVSPYMQLFRNDTAGGTIDNYTTLVRPQLQQQRMNQQFGTDIWGLQRDARIQQSSLQRMQNTPARCRAWARRSST